MSQWSETPCTQPQLPSVHDIDMMSSQQVGETDLLLPSNSRSGASGLLQSVNSKNALDRGALHRSDGDCTVISILANKWDSILRFIHFSSQRAESPLMVSHVQSDNSVSVLCYEVTEP